VISHEKAPLEQLLSLSRIYVPLAAITIPGRRFAAGFATAFTLRLAFVTGALISAALG
jgi:hypothetical protein